MKWLIIILLALPLFLALPKAEAQQRFPKPEFHTEYTQPTPTTPEPRGVGMEFVDVLVLLVVLSLTSWFAIRKRSRNGILLLTVFSAIYFGFYRNGCICSVGSIQNVALAFADPKYVISLYVILFFLIPLIFSLFFGRVFCAAACPLGAIQDLLIYKPITIPAWLRKTLGFIPYLYLGLAVLYAATGTDFIICRYDPFIGIYRMNGPHLMIFLGIAFLAMGLFIARPYCRFLCPYGAILNVFSRFSRKHLSVYPTKCIQCKLCTTACPFEAIDFPDETANRANRPRTRKFLLYLALIPVLMLAGTWVGSKSYVFLSRAHHDVYLAELLISHPELKEDPDNIDIQTFLASGKTLDTLVKDAQAVRNKFRLGSMLLGAYLGLVLGIMLLNQVIYRRKEDYQANKGNCFSCGRCIDYCPVTP
jgi:NosR/NirI family nitrous oxide reductase transcriptional regulator